MEWAVRMKTYRIYLGDTVVSEIECDDINDAISHMEECYAANPQLPPFSLTVSEHVGSFTLPRED